MISNEDEEKKRHKRCAQNQMFKPQIEMESSGSGGGEEL